MKKEKLRLLIGSVAQPGSPYGYGTIGKYIIETFKKIEELDVKTNAKDWDYSLVIGLPTNWLIGKGIRDDLIFHTMIETTPIPPGWADSLNMSRGVWAPSKWVKNLFLEGGVKVPIIVGGYGINDVYLNSKPKDKLQDGIFKVGVWGRSFISRKNVFESIKVFINANLTNSVLDVKLNKDDVLAPKGINNYDNIRIIKENWHTTQIRDWLTSLDVLLYLSGGEGFGLMPAESLACGTPVICANNTGMSDYLDEKYSYPVNSSGMRVSELYSKHFGYTAYEYKPDFDQAIELLRHAYFHRDELEQKGRTAKKVFKNMSWEKQMKDVYQKMKHYIF